jgi:hypothetical protein
MHVVVLQSGMSLDRDDDITTLITASLTRSRHNCRTISSKPLKAVGAGVCGPTPDLTNPIFETADHNPDGFADYHKGQLLSLYNVFRAT